MIHQRTFRTTVCFALALAIGWPVPRICAQEGSATAPPALSRVPASLLPGGGARPSALPSGVADPIRTPFASRVPTAPAPAQASVPQAPASVPATQAPEDAGASSSAVAPGAETAERGRGRSADKPGGLASTNAPERYQVGPGDVIRVTVLQEPDASGDFKVSPQGTIQHVLLGQIGIGRHTVAEITEVIRAALAAGYLRDPKVDVRVEEYHSQQAFVYGQVARPGTYELRGETDVLKILLDAGGPTHLAGDTVTLLHVTRTAKGEEVQSRTLSIERLLGRGDLSQNAPIASGDVIFVPGKDENARSTAAADERAYFVLGEVKNPGSFRFRDGATAMTAILEAGGFSEYARPNKTKLVRDAKGSRETKVLKMGEVMEQGDRSLDVKLLPGDVLVVPKSLF